MINMCAATSSPTQTTKVLVLGEKGVGKTCLIRSLLNEELPKVYESTQDNWYSTSIKITGILSLLLSRGVTLRV